MVTRSGNFEEKLEQREFHKHPNSVSNLLTHIIIFYCLLFGWEVVVKIDMHSPGWGHFGDANVTGRALQTIGKSKEGLQPFFHSVASHKKECYFSSWGLVFSVYSKIYEENNTASFCLSSSAWFFSNCLWTSSFVLHEINKLARFFFSFSYILSHLYFYIWK